MDVGSYEVIPSMVIRAEHFIDNQCKFYWPFIIHANLS